MICPATPAFSASTAPAPRAQRVPATDSVCKVASYSSKSLNATLTHQSRPPMWPLTGRKPPARGRDSNPVTPMWTPYFRSLKNFGASAPSPPPPGSCCSGRIWGPAPEPPVLGLERPRRRHSPSFPSGAGPGALRGSARVLETALRRYIAAAALCTGPRAGAASGTRGGARRRTRPIPGRGAVPAPPRPGPAGAKAQGCISEKGSRGRRFCSTERNFQQGGNPAHASGSYRRGSPWPVHPAPGLCHSLRELQERKGWLASHLVLRKSPMAEFLGKSLLTDFQHQTRLIFLYGM